MPVRLASQAALAAGLLALSGPALGQSSPGLTSSKPNCLVDPRTPIDALPFEVKQQGSYYLVADLTLNQYGAVGIDVDAPNVTIDLNGFCLSGGSVGGVGISTVLETGLTVFGGDVEGWTTGIQAGDRAVIRDVRVIDCSGYGILVQPDSLVEDCFVTDCQVGISASRGCRVVRCLVSDSSTGVSSTASRVVDCVLVENAWGLTSSPFLGGRGVSGCVSAANTKGAFLIEGALLCQWNLAAGSGAGVELGDLSGALVQDNLVYGNVNGIRGPGLEAVVTRNVASLNTTNFVNVSGLSDWGPIVGSTWLAGAWVNLSH